MAKRIPIATIKLAPGEAGYYDEYSRIYLSSTNPVATVYSGMNCTQIKKSIKSGRLRIVSGSFEEPAKEAFQPNIKKTKVQLNEEVKEEAKADPQSVVEIKETILESNELDIKTELKEEVKEEAPVKKTRKRTKKVEITEEVAEKPTVEEVKEN